MAEQLMPIISQYKASIDQDLLACIEELDIHEHLKASMQYSIEAGGKRVRPILMYLTTLACEGSIDKVKPVAIALELVHTYSLIHDDLPAMDDDDYRRGQQTNHKAFDEATAILAGDALLTLSFQCITNAVSLSAEEKVFALSRLSEVSGAKGMVGGQSLDLHFENTPIDLTQLEDIHHLKTGQLLVYAMEMGAYLAGAPLDTIDALKEAAKAIGLTFQIQDDILDVTSDTVTLGKPAGSDEANLKSTYPKLLGVKGAESEKQKQVGISRRMLEKAGVNETLLTQFITYLSNRDR
ncbi:farnesyl-diphosphate synthase [Streptohalobacillus salinus]|uniref:Farnesyl diphosphate synthase n=1 Tax=Streptohalobacillus salinus TaxID=621096 RepID=A0A2V3WEU6_9BACI|nr:farnesyl diphosphate synthase [Streptohalobacillus salinus]PXW91674.1 farnesyl-diphosphate synthase [Streptohalobacillus salinus]